MVLQISLKNMSPNGQQIDAVCQSSCMNLLKRLERNQPQHHFSITFCAFLSWIIHAFQSFQKHLLKANNQILKIKPCTDCVFIFQTYGGLASGSGSGRGSVSSVFKVLDYWSEGCVFVSQGHKSKARNPQLLSEINAS